MNLSLTQQELLNHLNRHAGISARELLEDIGEGRGLDIIALHNELTELEKLGLLTEAHEVNEGYVWWPASKMARA